VENGSAQERGHGVSFGWNWHIGAADMGGGAMKLSTLNKILSTALPLAWAIAALYFLFKGDVGLAIFCSVWVLISKPSGAK
jgi:hypothetical protein